VDEIAFTDALVFLITGVVSVAIKQPEIIRKRKSFILILALGLISLGVGVYILITGKTVR
jgi:hypothetical protein